MQQPDLPRILNAFVRLLPMIFFALLSTGMAQAQTQNFSGRWVGQIWQQDRKSPYTYECTLQQNGQQMEGEAVSKTLDGQYEARFLLTGYWDGSRWILQEVEQMSPATPKWCIKYITMKWSGNFWEGTWTADGCKPGHIKLARENDEILDILPAKEKSLAGSWQGRLSQSDRDYGFYYTLNLEAGQTGFAQIMSDGPGGNATHELEWSFSAKDSVVTIKELSVAQRTNPDWRWCIKTAKLKLHTEALRMTLEGNWTGHIEDHDAQSGACAPGFISLEMPLLPPQVQQDAEAKEAGYTTESGRPVKVDHVVEVKSAAIRLKVWDNGSVDGDVATLFLNGKRILTKHRVNKSKVVIPVNLKDENNILVLHAEDLGEITPNTVAVSVDDGKREQVIILSSNLKESGAMLIRQFKME